jgi:hypothetical protein
MRHGLFALARASLLPAPAFAVQVEGPAISGGSVLLAAVRGARAIRLESTLEVLSPFRGGISTGSDRRTGRSSGPEILPVDLRGQAGRMTGGLPRREVLDVVRGNWGTWTVVEALRGWRRHQMGRVGPPFSRE